MGWWNRDVVPRTRARVAAVMKEIDSDPEAFGDGQYADQVRGFLDVEALDVNCAIDIFRWGGASPEAMRQIDAAPYATVAAAGVKAIEWDEPPPPFLKTELNVRRTGGVATVEAVFRLIQTCRAD